MALLSNLANKNRCFVCPTTRINTGKHSVSQNNSEQRLQREHHVYVFTCTCILRTEITRCRQETAECGLPRRLSNAVRTDAKCEIVNQSPRKLNLKKTSTTSTNVLRKHNQTNKLTSANTNGQPEEPECVSRRCDNRNAACFAKC